MAKGIRETKRVYLIDGFAIDYDKYCMELKSNIKIIRNDDDTERGASAPSPSA